MDSGIVNVDGDKLNDAKTEAKDEANIEVSQLEDTKIEITHNDILNEVVEPSNSKCNDKV